jgi:hypothetical protein
MARKKAGIGDLIKSDMSRRNIGESPTSEELTTEPAYKAPEPAAPAQEPAAKTGKRPKAAGGALLLDYIAAEVESSELMDEAGRRNFYDFMLGQAARYIRGFKAGRRFHS